MERLDTKTIALLDKLYNLRGEDSVILNSIDEEKNLMCDVENKAREEKELLETRIADYVAEEEILEVEGKNLLDALSKVEKDQFAKVIEHLQIDFDPERIRLEVEKALPDTMKQVAKDKKDAEEHLASVEDEMNDAITRIEELGIRKDEAISIQGRLNHYINLALEGSSNITREEISNVLESLGFESDEIREVAKLMMFPEDGLTSYDKGEYDKPFNTKSITEVLQKAKENTVVVEEEKKEEERPVIEEVPEVSFNIPVIEPTSEVKSEELTKESLMNKLSEAGLDTLDFTNNDVEKVLNNFNDSVFNRNVELINNIGIEKDIFNDNVELLYDKDLEAKVDMLISVGKQPKDIYLTPVVLTKYTLGELNDAIRVLADSGLDPKNVPLMAY